jgi:chromosome segregation ATPase
MSVEALQAKYERALNELQTLQAKYERALNELQIAREQRERSEMAIARLGVEVGEWRGKWERSELERTVIRGQLDEMRTGRERAEERAERLQTEGRQLREMLEGKNQEIQGLNAIRD